MNFKQVSPAGHRVLIRPDEVETMTESGIILEVKDMSRKESAQISGTLIKIGPSAWKGLNSETTEPWAKEGDRVLFVMYGGYEVKIGGKLHRVMNDEDITAIVEES